MMARRTALLDPAQPSLFDPEPTTPPTPAPPKATPAPKRLRNHTLDLPRPWNDRTPCIATCLTCRRPEGIGACAGGCAVVCGRPNRTGPVEICLLVLTLPARTTPGGRHALVACPHCDGTHWHQPTPGRTYRIGQCGQPYIANVPERSTP